MDTVSTIIFCAIALLALFLLWAEGLLHRKGMAVIAVCGVAAAFVIRLLCMDYVTLDYENFLSRWVQYFRDNGGFAALDGSVGNYNLPYLYFLALFSYSPIYDLYLIKLLSIFFDVILAWACMKLTAAAGGSQAKRLFAFLATLLLPTVILNGALWGQCDSIYAALGLIAIWLAMTERPALSVVFMALSFSFKLQAIFLMPVYFILLYSHRVKFWHLLLFPLTYIIVVLPAVLAGRPFMDTLMLYFNQAGTVGNGLNYNSPSIFALIRGEVDEKLWSYIGIGLAFTFCALMFFLLWFRRRHMTRELILGAALMFAIGVPFFLPHMHDRYFFAADVLSLAVAAAAPEFALLPICVSFASLLGYHAYLKMVYLLPMRYGTAALAAALFLTAVYMVVRGGRSRSKKH